MKDKYGYHKTQQQRWLEKFKNGVQFGNPKGGHTSFIDKNDTRIAELVEEARESRQMVTGAEVNRIIEKRWTEVQRERGITNGEVISVSHRVRIKAQQGLKKIKGEAVNHARWIAMTDYRMFLVGFCMILAFMTGIRPELVMNSDDTTYSYGGSEDTEVWACKIKVEGGRGRSGQDEEKKKLREANKFEHANQLPQGIKYRVLGNSRGTIAPGCYIVAAELMPGEEYRTYKIPNLSTSTDASAYGYLCIFGKNRAGPEAFNEWWAKEILIDFVKKIRAQHGWTAEDDKALQSMDGEAKTLNPMTNGYTSPLLEAAGILLLKLCASCSLVAQAWDHGNFFNNSKKFSKRDDIRWKDATLATAFSPPKAARSVASLST